MLTPEQQMLSLKRVGASTYSFGARASLTSAQIDRGIVKHFRGPVMVAPDTAPAVVAWLIRTTRAVCRVRDRKRWEGSWWGLW